MPSPACAAGGLSDVSTLLPHGSTMEAMVESDGGHHIELAGRFSGVVRLGPQSCLVIAGTASVDAEILEAEQITILGDVRGRVRAQRVHLGKLARVTGEVEYIAEMTCERGATLNATVRQKVVAIG